MKIKTIINFILLFGICIFLTNCQHDVLQTNRDRSTDMPFKMEIISMDEITKNVKKSKAFNKYISVDRGGQNRFVHNTDYDFTVNTDSIKYVEFSDGSINSYTFNIERGEDNGYLENLVFNITARWNL